MREIRKPIKVLAIFEPNRKPVPVKYKIEEKGQVFTENVDKVVNVKEYLNGIFFECQTFFERGVKRYILSYNKETMQWELFKA